MEKENKSIAEWTDQTLIDADVLDGVKSFEYYWPQIRDHFDFEKVAKVMAFLDWGWSMHNGMKKRFGYTR